MHTSDIEAYRHAHQFHSTGKSAQNRTLRVVLLTVVMMVVEIVAGCGGVSLLSHGRFPD